LLTPLTFCIIAERGGGSLLETVSELFAVLRWQLKIGLSPLFYIDRFHKIQNNNEHDAINNTQNPAQEHHLFS
jgi:hypothetical protein